MKQKEIEFKSTFLKELRKNAKPLSQELKEEIKKPVKVVDKKTFLSTYDTGSLNIDIEEL